MNPRRKLQNEQGAVLITGLVLLVILTLLGLAAMQAATLQERMAGNLEQQDLAFQAAEAGLRDAEAWLDATIILPEFNNAGGLYQSNPTLWQQAGLWDDDIPGNYFIYQAGGLAQPLPRYVIEFMAEIPITGSDSVKFGFDADVAPGIYRITSRGVSPNNRGIAILQSTFIR